MLLAQVYLILLECYAYILPSGLAVCTAHGFGFVTGCARGFVFEAYF